MDQLFGQWIMSEASQEELRKQYNKMSEVKDATIEEEYTNPTTGEKVKRASKLLENSLESANFWKQYVLPPLTQPVAPNSVTEFTPCRKLDNAVQNTCDISDR